MTIVTYEAPTSFEEGVWWQIPRRTVFSGLCGQDDKTKFLKETPYRNLLLVTGDTHPEMIAAMSEGWPDIWSKLSAEDQAAFWHLVSPEPKQISQDISESSEEDKALIPPITGTQEVQTDDSVRTLARHLNDGFGRLAQNILDSVPPQNSGAETPVQVHLVDQKQFQSLICQPHHSQLCDAEGLFDIEACLASYTTQEAV
ncbi:hypothetical protein M231_05411 [Tremella mesenterica]|uniref:Uncharacterized protein n=1 Tax=Tremella mesenterica TaxID=5217 RepID=A0A4Q1BI75_TREME|nr:hypothetical protein M231_05411 [Tremella mesenterica]